MERWRWPLVVLLGFAMVSVAIYFGLNDRPKRGDFVEPPPARIEPPGSPAARAAATRAAQQSLEAFRSSLAHDCPAGHFALRLLFGPDGNELSRGVARRDGGDVSAAVCLSTSPHKLTIPAPGETVAVMLELRLP